MLLDVIEFTISTCSFFLASMWPELVCGLLAVLEMDEFDRIANASCDYEELTDSVNNFCNYEELKDCCSDKFFEVSVSISNKDRLPIS